jgi:hypothetical protein
MPAHKTRAQPRRAEISFPEPGSLVTQKYELVLR